MALERAHLNRLAGWGMASAIAGALLLLLVWRKRASMPMPFHFALQTTLWGFVELVFAGGGFRALALRDHAAAVSLDRMLWLTIGLETGYTLVGVTLVLVGWLMGRRLGVVGAGVGVAVQGAALVVLDLVLAGQVGPLL
ncbi:MAG: DUF6992 family protein [Gemmatimonadaceae bacterium]